MIGSVSVKVSDSRNSYTFTLIRNITVLCGDSGRGKTTLFEMVYDYNRFGKNSATKIVCNKEVIAVGGDKWQEIIQNAHDAIIVIDEDNQFVRSEAFAKTIKNSSNYYLLITRSDLYQLPISVNEIYELIGSKNKKFKRVYSDVYGMYDAPTKRLLPFVPEVILTEDSKTGFQFFKSIAESANIECVSAKGKSNIFNVLKENVNKRVLVIADGAAFGSEIRNIVERQKLFPSKIGIFLPESFEWLILKSGLICKPEWDKVSAPEMHVDSEKFFSWEQYFTTLLVETTKDMEYKKYPNNKSKLPQFYTQEKSVRQIKKIMQGIRFEDA